jgi:hypothetical protein
VGNPSSEPVLTLEPFQATVHAGDADGPTPLPYSSPTPVSSPLPLTDNPDDEEEDDELDPLFSKTFSTIRWVPLDHQHYSVELLFNFVDDVGLCAQERRAQLDSIHRVSKSISTYLLQLHWRFTL